MNNKRGSRTLLASLLLSAPGPVVLGLGLMVGNSSTQIADFLRRTVELAATLVSWYVYRATAERPESDPARVRLERRADLCVAAAMILSGAAMGFLAVSGFAGGAGKGNLIPALVIAILSLISNGILSVNYSISWRKTPNRVLKAQRTLYRTKTAVDAFVTAALIAVMRLTGSAQRAADLAGGLVVTAVLAASGGKLLAKGIKKIPGKSAVSAEAPGEETG